MHNSSMVRALGGVLVAIGLSGAGLLLLTARREPPRPGASHGSYVPQEISGLESCRESFAQTISEDRMLSGWCLRGNDTFLFVAAEGQAARLEAGPPPSHVGDLPAPLGPHPVPPVDALSPPGLELGPPNLLGSRLGWFTSWPGAPLAFVVRDDGLVLPLPPLEGDSAADPRHLADTCEWVAGASLGRDGRRRAAWWRRTC